MISNSKKPSQLLNSYLKVCFICLVVATISFLPIIVYNLSKGYDFNYVLDFNNQTIPYNMYMVHCLRSGQPLAGQQIWEADFSIALPVTACSHLSSSHCCFYPKMPFRGPCQ